MSKNLVLHQEQSDYLTEFRPVADKPIYLTLLSDCLAVGNQLVLEKDHYNQHDTEAIAVIYWDYREGFDCDMSKIYVANSVNTVARGTYSAGRIYDKFDRQLLVKVRFVVRGCAIAEVLGEVAESDKD